MRPSLTFKGVPRLHSHDNQETVEQSLETLEIAETKVTGIALSTSTASATEIATGETRVIFS